MLRTDEEKKKRRSICAIVGLLVALPIIYFIVSDESIKSLLLGIISSVIASLIFQIFSDSVLSDKSRELEELQSITKVLSEKGTNGVLKIQGRSSYESKFWINMLKETNDRLILSGRTLNRWIVQSAKQEFAENLKRILKNKGEITLVIYKNLSSENEKKEKELLHKFLKEDIFPMCVYKPKKRKKYVKKKDIHLNVLEVDILPYLYTANENKIIVAPYFQYVDNSNNIMFVLQMDCKYGEAYDSDFTNVINSADKNKWLDEYMNDLNNKVGKKYGKN